VLFELRSKLCMLLGSEVECCAEIAGQKSSQVQGSCYERNGGLLRELYACCAEPADHAGSL
jgi:hypothetical protein